jgi:hypothetical protein
MVEEQYPKEWTDAHFDTMSWHDCTIHGISLRNPHDGYDYDLVFDLDYILEWLCPSGKAREYAVAPALLTFLNVDKLHIDVRRDYKEALEIDHVEREEITSDAQRGAGIKVWKWKITLRSLSTEKSHITFEATGFKQILSKPAVRIRQQNLDFGKRCE